MSKTESAPMLQGQNKNDQPPAYTAPPEAPPQYQQYPSQPYPTQYPTGPTQQVVVAQPVPLLAFLGRNPTQWECQFCRAHITTATDYKVGNMNWLVAGVLCLALPGITWLGCSCIPFCMDSLKDIQHRCPNCHRILGTWSRTS